MTDTSGEKRGMVPTSDDADSALLEQLRADLETKQLTAAVGRRLGGGLHRGMNLQPATTLRNQMQKDEAHKEVGILDRVVTGSLFLRGRVAETWPEHFDGACPKCGQEQTEAHCFWQCPSFSRP